MRTNTWHYGFIITLPFRLDWRYFATPSFFNLGFIFGISGKCLWFYCLDKDNEYYIQEKESTRAFYYIEKQLGLKK
jgi:hypothetical protein